MKSFFKMLLASLIGTFIALFLCFIFFMSFIAAIVSISEAPTPIIPKKAILKVDLSTPILDFAETNPLSEFTSLNFDVKKEPISLFKAVQAIEYAATDPAIEFIYLNATALNTNLANLEEIRSAIGRFRKSGKAVIAYSDNYTQGGYYLASIADKIYINNQGVSDMIGIAANMMFFKNLFNKLGINVQLIRHGKFKAAAEQFVESEISKENLEQNQQMIKSLWSSWVNEIAISRNLNSQEFNSLVDNLELFTAESLLKNNLVDETLTNNEMQNKLCSLFGVSKVDDLKIVNLNDYAKVKIIPNIKEKNKIAVIYAQGEITMNDKNTVSAKKFKTIIRNVKKDSTIKAVVLRVNSPGGDAQAAEIINDELQLLRKDKPIVVSMGEYAASGGYWISANSERIFADNTTITGSIGVFSLAFAYEKGLKEHLNINNISIKSNEHSDMILGIRPLDNKETAFMQKMVDNIYTQFIDLVSNGRNLPISYVDSVGQGRVWTGEDAVKLQLVDEIGGLSTAIKYAASIAGLDSYIINEYPKPRTATEQLMEILSNTNYTIKALNNPKEFLHNIYTKSIKENKIRTYLRTPYLYEFRY